MNSEIHKANLMHKDIPGKKCFYGKMIEQEMNELYI